MLASGECYNDTCLHGPELTSRPFTDGALRKHPFLSLVPITYTYPHRSGCTNSKPCPPSSWRSSSSPFPRTPFAFRAHLEESWCPPFRTRTAGRFWLCLSAFLWLSSRAAHIARRHAVMSLPVMRIFLLNARPCMKVPPKAVSIMKRVRVACTSYVTHWRDIRKFGAQMSGDPRDASLYWGRQN